MTIHPDQFYHSDAAELQPIAKPQTWAAWRHQKRGPAYVKAGSRVIYKGADILSWLDSRRINSQTTEAA